MTVNKISEVVIDVNKNEVTFYRNKNRKKKPYKLPHSLDRPVQIEIVSKPVEVLYGKANYQKILINRVGKNV